MKLIIITYDTLLAQLPVLPVFRTITEEDQ